MTDERYDLNDATSRIEAIKDDLSDMQELLRSVQIMRREPKPGPELAEDISTLDKRSTQLEAELAKQYHKAQSPHQQGVMAAFQQELQAITAALHETPEPAKQRTPVNLSPKLHPLQEAVAARREIDDAHLQAGRRALNKLAEQVLNEPMLQEKVRAELPKALAEGRGEACVVSLLAQERDLLARVPMRPESEEMYTQALNGLLRAIKPQTSTGNVPRELKNKVKRFSDALTALDGEIAGLDTREKAVGHMQRLSKAAGSFFSNPKGDIIDWDAGYDATQKAFQASRAVVEANLLSEQRPYKFDKKLDAAFEQCAQRFEALKAQAKQLKLGHLKVDEKAWGRLVRSHGDALRNFHYQVNHIQTEVEKNGVKLSVVQTEMLDVFEEAEKLYMNDLKAMMENFKEREEEAEVIRLGTIKEDLRIDLSREHLGLAIQEKAYFEPNLKALEGAIQQRTQGGGLQEFIAYREHEDKVFAAARRLQKSALETGRAIEVLKDEYGLERERLQDAGGPERCIIACEASLEDFQTWPVALDFEILAHAFADAEDNRGVDEAVDACFKVVRDKDALSLKPDFLNNLAAIKQAMKAVVQDGDVVVDEAIEDAFFEMKYKHIDVMQQQKQAMAALLAGDASLDTLSDVQRTAAGALHQALSAIEAELGMPSQQELAAFEAHLGASPTPQAVLNRAITDNIEGLKQARQVLASTQSKHQSALQAQAARVKAAPSDDVFHTTRSAEVRAFEAIRPCVQDVAAREREVQVLIGQYEHELGLLKRRASRLTDEGTLRPGVAVVDEIKRMEKNLKGFEVWKTSSDFGQDTALLVEHEDDVQRMDESLQGFMAMLDAKEGNEFTAPEFKQLLTLLNHSMKKMAQDKQAVLGEQEVETYKAVQAIMEPWYSMKQEVDEALASAGEGAALTVVQQATLEGIQNTMATMEAEFGLPSKRDLVALGARHNVASVNLSGDEIWDDIESVKDKLATRKAFAENYIKQAAGQRRGVEARENAEEARQMARAHVQEYKVYLGEFRDALRALRLTDREENKALAEFEQVLIKLENNIDEPWDMQWAAAQMDTFVGGVKALASSGWEGLGSFAGWIKAGIDYLRGVDKALQYGVTPFAGTTTDFQRNQASFLIGAIATPLDFDPSASRSYGECGHELSEEKKTLLGMMSNFPSVERFEAQKQRVQQLEEEFEAACEVALEKANVLLNPENPEHELSSRQRASVESLREDILSKRNARGLTEAEKAEVNAITPRHIEAAHFIRDMGKEGKHGKAMDAAMQVFNTEKARLMDMLPSLWSSMGLSAEAAVTADKFNTQKNCVAKASRYLEALCLEGIEQVDALRADTSHPLREGQDKALERIHKTCCDVEAKSTLTASEQTRVSQAALQFMKPDEDDSSHDLEL